jgi:hypothetical protein
MQTIPSVFVEEAFEYALKSREYTSNRHDFHEGGLDAKQQKMFEGKLGEKIFKVFLINNNILFDEDNSSHEDADDYDFILPDGTTIDVKTRTEGFHIRTLEMVEQFRKKPKDIYVSVRLFFGDKKGFIIGWCTKDDILRVNKIENQGYLDNYVMYDIDLNNINLLSQKLKGYQV